MDPAKLQPGHVVHELTPEQVRRITKVQDTFREVDPSPPSKWLDDFKRDENPDREILIYEGMAEAFAGFCSTRNLSLAAKSDVYQVVLLRSGAPDDQVLKRVHLKALTIVNAKEILALYKMPPSPVIVGPAPPKL